MEEILRGRSDLHRLTGIERTRLSVGAGRLGQSAARETGAPEGTEVSTFQSVGDQ